MSNKTLNEPPNATASVPNRKNPVHLILGVLLLSFGFAALWSGVRSATDNKQQLFTPNTRLLVEVVETDEDRRIGLSGRDSLQEKNGMLFVFEKDQASCFWMDNTFIPLDMIWLNEDKEVVFIHENAEPLSRTSICPDEPATYVLEVNGGKAQLFGIEDGSSLRF